MKTYIVLDESGAMHLKDERYFIIGGFITNELHKVRSAHKKAEEIVKKRKNIPLDKKIELKSSKINKSQQIIFLNRLYSLSQVVPIVIIVDKYNLTKFKASENLAYNFFVKNLLNYLFNCNILALKTKEIELRLDNRNNSVKTLNDLETFLEWEYNYMHLNFKVKFLNSKDSREVQMADYIANLFWKKFNKNNELMISKVLNIHKTFISKFPIKEFGKNPTLRELNNIKNDKSVVKS